MEDAPRPYLIPVRRRWTLWILPVLALLYFLFIVVLASFNLEVAGVSMDLLVLAGTGVFAAVLVIELPFFIRRRRPKAEPDEPAPAPEAAAEPFAGEETILPEPEPVAPTQPAPAAPAPKADDECLVTSEEQRGHRVLEYSVPAKSNHRGAVYAKTMVPVGGNDVLRIETLAAEPHEL